MMPVPQKKKPADNFKLALGMGVNWVDLDSGIIYMIQEYKEALDDPTIPKENKPTKIRMINSKGDEIGWADPDIVQKKMSDPDPDPKYAPETPYEHRHSW